MPDVSKRELSKNTGVFRFPRVSCAAASADEADLDPNVAGELNLLRIWCPFVVSVQLELFTIFQLEFRSFLWQAAA